MKPERLRRAEVFRLFDCIACKAFCHKIATMQIAIETLQFCKVFLYYTNQISQNSNLSHKFIMTIKIEIDKLQFSIKKIDQAQKLHPRLFDLVFRKGTS